MLAMGRSCRDSPAYWVPRSLFCLSNMWCNHPKLWEIVEIYFFWFWVKLSTSSFIIIPQTFPGNPRDPPIFADLELRGGSEITDGSLFIVQLTSERPPPFSRPQIGTKSPNSVSIRSRNQHFVNSIPHLKAVPLNSDQICLLGKAEDRSCWCRWYWQGLRWERPEKFSLKAATSEDCKKRKLWYLQKTAESWFWTRHIAGSLFSQPTANGRHSASKLQRRKLQPTWDKTLQLLLGWTKTNHEDDKEEKEKGSGKRLKLLSSKLTVNLHLKLLSYKLASNLHLISFWRISCVALWI